MLELQQLGNLKFYLKYSYKSGKTFKKTAFSLNRVIEKRLNNLGRVPDLSIM